METRQLSTLKRAQEYVKVQKARPEVTWVSEPFETLGPDQKTIVWEVRKERNF